ncbi:MAG: DsrE family protein [Pricia sp.]
MKNSIFLAILFLGPYILAQETSAGPILKNFGKVYKVNPDYKVDTEMHYKVVFDIDSSAEAMDELSSSLNTPARFLNMQAQSGVPLENMSVALVIHGAAFKDILVDSAYSERFQTDNPTRDLVQALLSSGVEIILCGQTAGYRKVAKEDMIPGVQTALSAMNALVQLQSKEYQLIKF